MYSDVGHFSPVQGSFSNLATPFLHLHTPLHLLLWRGGGGDGGKTGVNIAL